MIYCEEHGRRVEVCATILCAVAARCFPLCDHSYANDQTNISASLLHELQRRRITRARAGARFPCCAPAEGETRSVDLRVSEGAGRRGGLGIESSWRTMLRSRSSSMSASSSMGSSSAAVDTWLGEGEG